MSPTWRAASRRILTVDLKLLPHKRLHAHDLQSVGRVLERDAHEEQAGDGQVRRRDVKGERAEFVRRVPHVDLETCRCRRSATFSVARGGRSRERSGAHLMASRQAVRGWRSSRLVWACSSGRESCRHRAALRGLYEHDGVSAPSRHLERSSFRLPYSNGGRCRSWTARRRQSTRE